MSRGFSPVRRCAGCGEKKEKSELIRIARTPEITDETGKIIKKSEVIVDLKGKSDGRGVYVCKTSMRCLKKVGKNDRLGKLLKHKVPSEVYDILERIVEENE